MRASALNRRLFTSVGEIGPLLELALVAAGVIFLALEFAALITGIVLTRTITRAVGDLYEATLHVRRGDFTQRIHVHQRDQLGALGESFNEMTSSISELIEEQSKRQRLENEIAIAREVQEQLFPRTSCRRYRAWSSPPSAAPPASSAATITISFAQSHAWASHSRTSAGKEFSPRC